MSDLNFTGFDIHMSGNRAWLPLTQLSKIQNTNALMAYTKWNDGSDREQLVIGAESEISIARTSNDYYVVIVNTEAFSTAMLLCDYGLGHHGCFTTDLGYSTLITEHRLNSFKGEMLHAVPLEDFYVEDQYIMESIKESIRCAFIDMDRIDNYAKFKLQDRYAQVIAPYLNL